ncbi:MAG: (2Fe-2S)-binding protein [Synergistaceae bacterium]|jgi:aerobic-type carbon monoxide dehydrogenase small subunit (CoxS/CutS family)|nr:(2Fe-2S)-binding protein [Synergistaceae bacterium]
MDLIEEHPVLESSNFRRGEKVEFTFDGVTMEGFGGAPIAAALHANGVRVYRETPNMNRPRGFFCAIGKCSSCFMVVDGVPNVRTCVTPLAAGMEVRTQHGRGRARIVPVPAE